MVCIRPNIALAIGVVIPFLSNLGKEHWIAVEWIFRYIRDASIIYLYFGNGKLILDGYTHSDMAHDLDSRESISGYLMNFLGEQCHGSLGYKNILLDSLKRSCILQLQKLKKNFYG